VLVEFDDWDSFGEAHTLLDGDEVTVYGRIDKGLFEQAKIEAGSVYVDGLKTFFYASSADEEGDVMAPHRWVAAAPFVTNQATIQGTVSGVDADEAEITVDTGLRLVTVDLGSLGYNPLDSYGYQRIDRGDRVSVSGRFDRDFLEGRELEADTLITLDDNTSRSG
jgi:hypothetical protein